MKTVLVTGGAGYIGSHALKALGGAGFIPVCFDDLSTGFRGFAADSSFFQGSLANPADLEQALDSAGAVAAVIHFASHALVGESFHNPFKYYHDNIVNALNLLEAMRKRRIRNFVFSSSCATYGIPRRVPITETEPLDPINPYGATKMMIERILSDYEKAFGIRFVSLRYFNAAGADADGTIGEQHVPETHLIPRLFEAAMERAPAAQVYGDDYPTPDGTCLRDYIHVTDLAAAHVAALDHLLSGNTSDIFNLGTGKGFSVLQVLDQVRKCSGKEVPVEIAPRRPGDPPELVADPRKAQATLRWHARHSSLEEIVGSAWNWHRTHV